MFVEKYELLRSLFYNRIYSINVQLKTIEYLIRRVLS